MEVQGKDGNERRRGKKEDERRKRDKIRRRRRRDVLEKVNGNERRKRGKRR